MWIRALKTHSSTSKLHLQGEIKKKKQAVHLLAVTVSKVHKYRARMALSLNPTKISLFELTNDLGITNVFSATKEASLAKNARNTENPNGIDP